MAAPIRILSDLHFRHPAGFVQRLTQIAPLLEGVEQVVFNGDSVEARFLEERERGTEEAEHLRDFCRSSGAEAILLTGNHDPLVTAQHHLELADGAVLVTHGDVLFHGLAPWSRELALFAAAHERALAEHPPTLEGRLAAAREVALAVEQMVSQPHHRAAVKTLSGFVRQVWPPIRVVRMLGCWWKLPDLAAAFLSEVRPEAKCVIVGHTHRAGVWQRGVRRVVNTGAFLPWAGRLMVDLCGGEVIVRAVEDRAGLFYPGKIVARWSLDSPLDRD